MRRQRSFVPQFKAYAPADMPTYAAREAHLGLIARRYPGCTSFPAEEALLIGALVLTLEERDAAHVAEITRKCRLPVPTPYRHDRFRLIKNLLAHWHDPMLREQILSKALIVKRQLLMREFTILTPQKANKLLRRASPTFLLGPMLAAGFTPEVEAILSMLDEEALTYYRGDVLLGQIICYKLWREKEPRSLPLRGKRELAQRLRRRNLSLRHLQHSLYHLNQDRKALVRLSWEAERGAREELDQLIRQQGALLAQLDAVHQAHASRLGALRTAHAEKLRSARMALEERRRMLAEALAERGRWNRPQPLSGQTVLVLGDMSHAETYEGTIRALGGRPLVLDGLDRIGRIREAAPDADAVILITAAMTHAAQALLTASLPAGVPVLYCPRAGQASLERTLRAELLPRQIARQAAASEQGGAPDAG